MKADELIAQLLEEPHVPLPFASTFPLTRHHHCPACRRDEDYDRNTGLCQSCHGALRIVRAMKGEP